jgi:hypothetical protein
MDEQMVPIQMIDAELLVIQQDNSQESDDVDDHDKPTQQLAYVSQNKIATMKVNE